MKKLFKHIRSQPKAKRESYALIVASAFTSLVAIVWAFSLPEKMGTIADGAESDSPAPFSSLFKEVGEQFAAAKAGFNPKKDEGTTDADASNAAATSSIILTPEEVENAKKALESNATDTESVASTSVPVPVLIGTTTATTTYTATSTP